MSEYIEREALLAHLEERRDFIYEEIGKSRNYNYYIAGFNDALCRVEYFDVAADVEEVKHGNCSWCKPGDERCGTCVKFFDYHGDGGSDKCSASCVDIRCVAYEPMHACPNCGAKIGGE